MNFWVLLAWLIIGAAAVWAIYASLVVFGNIRPIVFRKSKGGRK